VVEGPALEIRPVVSFESAMVMLVIITIAIMAIPGRIVIIGIARVISFIYNYGRRCSETDVGVYADLCMGRCCCQAPGYDHG